VTTTAEPNDLALQLVDNVEKVIIGKRDSVQLGVVALIAGGHALIEDVPGVGKTLLARSIARSAGCQFRRLQFTPDLLPSDITGVSVYNQKTNDFEFRQGPIISEIVLADEINRATPKTQSALLEAMEEGQISVDGVTYALPAPFMVLATQNPIEYEGTFPLPEAQLDRFFLRISMGYPDPTQEIEYIVTLSNATRDHSDIALGVSPRASLALLRGSQAIALMEGREYVIPDDVKGIAVPVMSHRLILTPAARMREATAEIIISEILGATPVPGGSAGPRPTAESLA